MQQPLPDLPPMKPVEVVPPPSERPVFFQRQVPPPAVPLGWRLRQMVGLLAGGGFLMMTGVGALELIAKPGLRPTDLLATFEARTDLGIMNQKLGSEPGELVLTEDDYRKRLAQADREGQAAAELGFQTELALVQADKERVVQAYASLYQRANMIAQAAIQLEALAQQFRQQLLAMTNGGRDSSLCSRVCSAGWATRGPASRRRPTGGR